MRYMSELSVQGKLKLISDNKWWIAVLKSWASDSLHGNEYPILSASRLMEEPHLMYVVQSDASGEDGFGYLHGSLQDECPRFAASAWGGDYEFGTSHNGELQGLLHFTRTTTERSKVLVWVSDSLSGVWSVLKGRCKEERALVTLEALLQCCDEKKLQLIALWVPRELNLLPDYLSHLCAYMNRDQTEGYVDEL